MDYLSDMLYILLGIVLLLFGLYHLVRHLRLEVKKRREDDKLYREYKGFRKEMNDSVNENQD